MVRATAVAALCERRAFLLDIESGDQRPPLQNLRAVAANRLDRASFHRFLAQGFFLRRFGLFIDIRMAAVIVATKIRSEERRVGKECRRGGAKYLIMED